MRGHVLENGVGGRSESLGGKYINLVQAGELKQ